MTIPAAVSTAFGGTAEEIREQRKFAEKMKPKKSFKRTMSPFAEKSPNQRGFSEKMGVGCEHGETDTNLTKSEAV